MSAAERNRYVSPLRGPLREGTSAPIPTPAGTFGTAPRFGVPSQTGGYAPRARSPSAGYAWGASSATPVRRGGYAEMAQARSNQAQVGALSLRSKTPAAPRPSGTATGTYAIPERRATTPPPRAAAQYSMPLAATSGVGGSGRRTMPAIPSTTPSRQPTTPGRDVRGLAADRNTMPRTPGRTPQGSSRGASAQSPPRQDAGGRRYTTPNLTGASRARRLAYDNSPFATPRAAYRAAARTTGARGITTAPPAGGLPRTISSVRPAGISGRFQEPGDDWLSSYEKSSMGLLRELERVLGGYSRTSGLVPATMEAGAPPRQLPLVSERAAPAGAPAPAPGAVQAQRPSAGSASQTSNAYGGAGTVPQNTWDALEATGGASAPPLRRTAWTESSSASSPLQASEAPPPQVPAVGLTYTYLQTGASAAAAGPAASAATPLAAPSPTQGSAGYPAGPAPPKRSRTESNDASLQDPAAASEMVVAPAAAEPPAITTAGSMGGQLAHAAVPSGTIAELWNVLQACRSTTTRLMTDLATARREVELANERAEEADSLARNFQNQLIERQKSVSAWQTALAEMEEREAAARQQLAEVQARCSDQALRAQQAEHVAAAIQLRLERFMAQQQTGQPGADQGTESRRPSTVEAPNPQLQQQLEQLQADLAAAKTRSALAELELAVARNKALIAQQELSAEEERARRAAAAAAAARQELGRTRSALELMGRDHDRLQSQLEDVRSKIGDVVQRPLGSSRPDLLAPADQGPPHARAAHPQQGAAQAEGSSRLPSHKSVLVNTAAGNPSAGTVHAVRAAATTSGVSEWPKHSLSHHSARERNRSSDDSGLSGGGSDEGAGQSLGGAAGSFNTDDDDDDASPRRPDGALSPSRRCRGGSLLLVPPGVMPAETSASVRYGHRMVMRQHSRSQDLGLVESPRDLGPGSAAEPALGKSRSPRTMSGSHDGVVRRLNMDFGRRGRTTGEGFPDEADGGGSGLLGSGVVTEEMLPLSRTPSSGTRRRLSSLRISQVSSSRETPPPTRMPSDAAAAAPTAVQQTPSQASASETLERTPSGRMPTRQLAAASAGREPQAVAPSTAPEPRAKPKHSSAEARPVQEHPQQQTQKQSTNRQDSLIVSLADLRRQMAAAQAAAASDASAGASQQGTPAPKAQVSQAAAALPAAATTAARKDSGSQLPQPPRRQSPTPPHAQRQPLSTHHSQPMPAPPAARATPAAATQTGAAAGGSRRQARSALPELLPPLEQSNSPPERSPQAAAASAGDGGGASRSSLTALHSPTPQPGVRPPAALAATAAASGPTSPAAVRGGGAAATGPVHTTTVSYRLRAAGGAVPSRLGAKDMSPPQGYNTTHLNDLYESMQSVRFSVIPPLPAPTSTDSPRGWLLPPPPARGLSEPRQRGQDPVAGASAVAAATTTTLSTVPSLASGRSGFELGAASDGRLNAGPHLAFTPRSRMLSPSQLDSHLVSPSVTNSMAAVASIDGHLPAAASATQQWRPLQPPQHQEQLRHLAPSPLRGTSAASHSQAASPEPSVPRSQPAALTAAGIGAASASGRAVGVAACVQPQIPGAGSASPVCGSPQPRRAWWQRLLPPRRRRAGACGAAGSDAPQGKPASTASTVATSLNCRSPVGSSPSQARAGSGDPKAVSSPRTLDREPFDRPMGRAGSTTAADCHSGDITQGGAGDPAAKSPRQEGGNGGGGLLRSALLHLGVWSGGMAVGVLLVLGVTGIVEGTLGLGAGRRQLAGGASTGDPCGCPPPDSQSTRRTGRGGKDGTKDFMARVDSGIHPL